MSIPTKLDHCVIHVSDWERSNAFYTTVLGAQLVTRPTGYAYRFGDKQLNVHGPGVRPAEVARIPVRRAIVICVLNGSDRSWKRLRI
jgi:catechol 2,3-dioxygenase-like lactoylglutathione lyase family enzyme